MSNFASFSKTFRHFFLFGHIDVLNRTTSFPSIHVPIFLFFNFPTALVTRPSCIPVYANRAGVKAHARHAQDEYQKQLRTVQLIHARSQFEQTPAPPAAH